MSNTNQDNNKLPPARLLDFYKNKIVKEMQKEKGYTNIYAVPKITKLVLTTCLGKYFRDAKTFESMREDFENVCLQKSIVVTAKKSIASFNLREGMQLGYKTTLRGNKMYYFLDRLINLVFVSDREFRGISAKAITGHKNSGYSISLGLNDLSIFPEVEKKSLTGFIGMGITICTTAKTKEEFVSLLEKFDFPFKKGN